MKPTNFLKSKDQYALLVFLYLCTGFSIVNSQIIYTDIIPDYQSQVLGDLYNLDLNNDGIIDFIIVSEYYPYYDYLKIDTEIEGNSFIGLSPWYVNILPLNPGDFIGPNPPAEWYTDSYGIFSIGCPTFAPYCYWSWENTSNKFLGLRFKIGNQFHYGWARLDVTDETHWIIKDYAYYGIADVSINAGQITLGIDDNSILKNIKIIASNNFIKIYNLTETINFKVYSITGSIVAKGSLSMENDIVNTISYAKGLYIIELEIPNSGQKIKKKIII